MGTQNGMKALRVSIYESKDIGNCSNHGISERFKEILLLCDEGNVAVTGEEENLCRVSSIMGHLHVQPVYEPDRGCVGWMFGGSLVHSSDARFNRLSGGYPLSLHDRQETQELYNALSR